MSRVRDTRIVGYEALLAPAALLDELPLTAAEAETVERTRAEVRALLDGADGRLLIVAGPCSVHDPKAALDYAARLIELRDRYADDLLIVMRVYFEKPRTVTGWKGLINDPGMDESFDVHRGLRAARRLLLDILGTGMPVGCEWLDPITPQYIADAVAWGAIGARTTESQVHRQLASGLSCPVGFKNGTDGGVRIAVDAIKAASAPHHFLSVTKGGHSAIVHTAGNEDCHIILRGGAVPNYDAASVEKVCGELGHAGVAPRVMIDCSHANSQKQYERQLDVAHAVAGQIARGDDRVIGAMIESHINPGRQDLVPGQPLAYGVSITDACVGWDATVGVLRELADAVRHRRVLLTDAS